MKILPVIIAVALMPASVHARQVVPAVPGYGAVHIDEQARERPDPALRYRVVFEISAAGQPGKVHSGLDKVARFLNLLAVEGIRPAKGDIVAVVHGPAASSFLTQAAYAKRNAGSVNANLALIERLRDAGVVVSVCSQALAAQKITTEEVAKGVRVDVSALTTLANLQLRGFALIAD
jgi:intracellular sulfur oxidation DsrE/DsrF family protein